MSNLVLFFGFGQLARHLASIHYRSGDRIHFVDPKETNKPDLAPFSREERPIVYYTSAAQTRLRGTDCLEEIELFNIKKPQENFQHLHSTFHNGTFVYFNTCHIYREKHVTHATSIEPISRYAESKLRTEDYLQNNCGDWSLKSLVLFPTISPLKSEHLLNRLYKTVELIKSLSEEQDQSFCFSDAEDTAAEIVNLAVAKFDTQTRLNLDFGTRFSILDLCRFIEDNRQLLQAINRRKNALDMALDKSIEPYEFDQKKEKKSKDELFARFLID